MDAAQGVWVEDTQPPATRTGHRFQIRATRDGRYLARMWHPDRTWCRVEIGTWHGWPDHVRYFGVTPLRSPEQERLDAARELLATFRSRVEGAVSTNLATHPLPPSL